MPVSVRNLQESGLGPLRRFRGRLQEVEEKEETGRGGTYTRVFFRFSELVVKQSIEPYAFPIAEISIVFNPRKRSRWGFYGESVLKFLSGNEDFKDTVGKEQEWVMCDGVEGRPAPKKVWSRDEKKEVDAPSWEVLDIAGSKGSATSSEGLEHLKGLLDGKSLSEFNKVAFSDPVVKASPDIQTALTNRTFINSLVQLGEFTKDSNDILHRVKK